MRTRDYRRLRQVELIRFAIRKYGMNHWRAGLRKAVPISQNDTLRWQYDDIGGNIQEKVEQWAEREGFHSVYDSAPLDTFKLHVLILNGIMEKARARWVAEGKMKRLPGAALPFNTSELEQAFAGLGLDLKPNI